MRLLLLSLVLMSPACLVAEEGDGSPPSDHVVATALEWMQSSDPDRRQAAYRSVHLLGREALPAFEKALRAARRHHERRLDDILKDRDNPYGEMESLADELQAGRERVLPLIRTDWKKNPEKIRMLRNELDALDRIYKRAAALTESDPSDVDRDVKAIATALAELRAELALFEFDGQDARDGKPPEDLRREALRESFDGERYLENKARFAAMKSEVQQLQEADQHNASRTWANSSQKDFASLLNHERAVLGLPPLRLDEQLSAAAAGHSRDMRSRGFFSHTSPAKGKRSPAARARKAGFRGGFRGENIFVGSPAHTGAYNAWFASDGHRFIMFAKGPNVLGLGPVGRHWTLMTGRR